MKLCSIPDRGTYPSPSADVSADGSLVVICQPKIRKVDDAAFMYSRQNPWFNTAWVYYSATGECLLEIPDVDSARFLADSGLLAAFNDHSIRVFDVASGKRLSLGGGHIDAIRSIAWSSDGRLLATVGDNCVWIWGAATGKPRAFLRHGDMRVGSAEFLETANRLRTSASDGERIWDTDSGTVAAGPPVNRELRPEEGTGALPAPARAMWVWFGKGYSCEAVSPDGTTTATARWTKGTGEGSAITVRGTVGGHKVHAQKMEGIVTAMAYSPNGSRLAVAAVGVRRGDGLWILDSGTLEPVTRWQAIVGENTRSGMGYCTVTPDGRYAAHYYVGDRYLFWDLGTGLCAGALHHGVGRAVDHPVFSPDGVYAMVRGRPRLYSVATRQLIRELDRPDRIVTNIAFSPDGGIVATGNLFEGEETMLHDVKTGKRLSFDFGRDGCTEFAFSPDGARLLTTFPPSNHGTGVQVWDVRSGKLLIERWCAGHHGRAVQRGPVFAAGGRHIIVRVQDSSFHRTIRFGSSSAIHSFKDEGARDGYEVEIWDSQDLSTIQVLGEVDTLYWSILLSRDGRTVLLQDDDGTIHVWRYRGP
ncbi:MAG: WD40 repeat domain-containing protein [Planctomycetota bacterium]